MKIRYFIAAGSIGLLVPSAAHAFPLAEGTSSIGAIIGMLGGGLSAIGGVAAERRSNRWVLAASALLAVIALVLGGMYASLEREVSMWDRAIRQNTPAQTLGGRANEPMQIDRPTSDELAWARSHGLFISLDDFQAGRVAEQAEPVYLNRRDDESYQPMLVRSFRRSERSQVLEYALTASVPLVLVSEQPRDIIEIAQDVLSQGGPLPRGIVVTSSDFVAPAAEELPYVMDHASIFERKVVEIRPPGAVRVSHTLGNARLVPFYDMLLMRNADLSDAFEWPVVFTSYDEGRYSALNARLTAAGMHPGADYSFYKGGLKEHYEEAGLGIVPEHYNVGLADISTLMDVAFLTGRLRFICTRPETCQENIPADMRIDVPFRDLGREDARAAIEGLDPALLYAAMSGDQETTGNAYLVGWWLIASGHNYLGEATQTGRFSPNLLWDRMRSHHGEGEGIDAWRRSYALRIWALEALGEAVDRYGWFLVFLGLGATLRICLLPLQYLSTRASFYPQRKGILPLLSALGLMVVLLWSYAWLAEAIRYFAVVPHAVMESLRSSGPGWLDEALAVGLVAHIWLSMPTSRRMSLALAGVILGLYGFEVLDGIPDPLTAFLIAGECVALGLLIPMAIRMSQFRTRSGSGLHACLHAGNFKDELPEKWRMVEEFRHAPGFLSEVAAREFGKTVHEAMLLATDRLIVRSASHSKEEQGLGGFHRSRVIDKTPAAIIDALSALTDEGCSHAWIQPWIACDEAGVVMSIDGEGRRAAMMIGKGDAATEGTRHARKVYLISAQRTGLERRVYRLLRQAEKHFKGPVVLEVGVMKDDVHLFQVRRQDAETAQETAMYPDGIEGAELAESYIARPSRLTGSTIARVTRGDFVYVRGFLYRRSRVARPILPRGRARLERLEKEIIALAVSVEIVTRGTLAQKLAALREALWLYGQTYLATQARLGPKELTSILGSGAWDRCGGHELEISGRAVLKMQETGVARIKTTRDALHDMSALLSATLCILVAAICETAEASGEMDIRSLLDPDFAPGPDHRDAAPLGDERSAGVIVPGVISGEIWAASNPPEADCARGKVLVGEEIGSEWVRHLHRFTGIVSVYGDANAHLGLSARAMNMPYRKVSPEELEKLLEEGCVALV